MEDETVPLSDTSSTFPLGELVLPIGSVSQLDQFSSKDDSTTMLQIIFISGLGTWSNHKTLNTFSLTGVALQKLQFKNS